MCRTVLIALMLVALAAGIAPAGDDAPDSAAPNTEALEAAVSANPDDVALRVRAGRAWLELARRGDGDAVGKAEAHLDRALELAPDDPQILALSGTVLCLKGRDAKLPVFKMRHVQKGLKKMDRAVELAPMDFGIRWQRGATCLNLPPVFERSGTAVEDFTQLLAMAEHAPQSVPPAQVVEIKLNLARARMAAGESDAARALLGEMVESGSEETAARARRPSRGTGRLTC